MKISTIILAILFYFTSVTISNEKVNLNTNVAVSLVLR